MDQFLMNQEYEKYYHIECTKLLCQKYGTGVFTDSEKIHEIYKTALTYYCDEFSALCKGINSYEFYSDIFNLYNITHRLSEENKVGIIINDERNQDFINTKRVIKLILGKACKTELHSDSFLSEKESEDCFMRLKSLGFAAYKLANSIHSSYILGDGFIEVEINEYGFLPYLNILFPLLYTAYVKCTNILQEQSFLKYALQPPEISIPEFKDAVEKCFGKDAAQLIEEISGIGDEVCYLQNDIDAIDDYSSFSKGLTLNKHNSATVKEAIMQPYNLKRCKYRPFLEWNVNSQTRQYFSKSLFHEATVELITNCIPWNKIPDEWITNKPFKEYAEEKFDQHAKWLEDMVEKFFKENQFAFLRNKKVINNIHLQGTKAEIENKVGEIDFIFIDEKNEIVYVADCKNNRTRYDMASWSSEASNYKNEYNDKLRKKLEWITCHLNDTEVEFKKMYKKEGAIIPKLSSYQVKAFYIVDTPTFYMYNSIFRIVSIRELKTSNDSMLDIYIDIKVEGKSYRVNYPIFDNIKNGNYHVVDDDQISEIATKTKSELIK